VALLWGGLVSLKWRPGPPEFRDSVALRALSLSLSPLLEHHTHCVYHFHSPCPILFTMKGKGATTALLGGGWEYCWSKTSLTSFELIACAIRELDRSSLYSTTAIFFFFLISKTLVKFNWRFSGLVKGKEILIGEIFGLHFVKQMIERRRNKAGEARILMFHFCKAQLWICFGVEDLWIDLKKMNVGAIFEKRQDTTSVLDNEKWAYLTGSISKF